jgi:catechol 2,3-dioxygenase-like lactoylglutathione lyase family enzyme
MNQKIGYVTLVVRDYDEAIAFYTQCLRFDVVADDALGGDRRWVLVRPPGEGGTALLLARASSAEQEEFIGNQDRALAAGLDLRRETEIEIELLRRGGMIPVILRRDMRWNTGSDRCVAVDASA